MSAASILAVVLVGGAGWWAADMVTLEHVFEPLRDRVRRRWPSTAAQQVVVRREDGVYVPVPPELRRKVRPYGPGFLIGCPRCASVWTTTAWYVWWAAWTRPGWPVGVLEWAGSCAAALAATTWATRD